MAWKSLQNSLGSKPRVLAGPILRKVTPKSVTVWLALRVAGKVVLIVQDDQQTKVMEGAGDTIAIGKNLHIVAITAKPVLRGGDLTEGIVYRYDLAFNFADNLGQTLVTATSNADLGYPPHTLPSFALPPKDPSLLRLIQGSCRMPHAEGKDTLPLVDNLIAETALNAFARPHQLLLTGDQIYADDVAASMLVMLMDAADTLLEWKEVLPLPMSHGGPVIAAKLSPFNRGSALEDAGFTSVDLDAHLMSLGEYLCMYLFVWSDALWPTTALPSFADVLANVKANVDPRVVSHWEEFLDTKKKSIELNIGAMTEFRQGLPKVRRALANIPSYMIFDDHEVTDDWNMTRNFCHGVYGKPLGLRVVQNALVAYSLCQHWGNAPEQFEGGTPVPAGFALLRLLDTPNPTATNAFDQKAASLDQHSGSIIALLGLHDDTVLADRPHHGLFHDPHSLQYHYTIEGLGHQVIFTDTRTWRSFPYGGNETSELLPKDQFRRQILDTLDTKHRVLLVVLSTNAPPVQLIRTATRHAWTSNHGEHYPDIYEAWELPSVPFDRLLKTLTDKLPMDASGQRKGAVILLSGDVHHSFASRLAYRATMRFDDLQPQPATAVFAQLVASSFKKQTESTRGLHREGYTYLGPWPRMTKFLGWKPPHRPEYYAGWNIAPDAPGSGQVMGRIIWKTSGGGVIGVSDLTLTQPTVALQYDGEDLSISVEFTRAPPDYRYRLDYLIPSRQGALPLRPPPIPPIRAGATPEQRKQAAQAFNVAAAHYRHYNDGFEPTQKIIGVNNFGEITFDWGPGDNKKVNHTLRWHNPKVPDLVTWTTYTVNLNPNEFPLQP